MSDAVQNIKTIAKRELSGYFASPVAYVFIVIWLLLNGFFTFALGGFFEMGQASLTMSFFRWHPWLYLFLVPAVGMRLWSEERRLHTMELLLTMPITTWQAIIGKFIASWLFLIIALALTFPVVITVCYLGDADLGEIFTGYVGSALLAGGYLAVTSMTSAMTRNQVISFIVSVVVCFFLLLSGLEPVQELVVAFTTWLAGLGWGSVRLIIWMILLLGIPASLATLGLTRKVNLVGIVSGGVIAFVVFVNLIWRFTGIGFEWISHVVSATSSLTHFIAFQKGVLDSHDLVYFASLIGFALFLNGVIIRNLRAG